MKSYLNLFFSDRQSCQHGLPTDHEMAKRLAKLKVKTVTVLHTIFFLRVQQDRFHAQDKLNKIYLP